MTETVAPSIVDGAAEDAEYERYVAGLRDTTRPLAGDRVRVTLESTCSPGGYFEGCTFAEAPPAGVTVDVEVVQPAWPHH